MNVFFLQALVATAVLLPLAAAAILALAGWFGARLGERAISAVVGITYATTTLVALGAAVGGFVDGRPIVVDFGEVVTYGHLGPSDSMSCSDTHFRTVRFQLRDWAGRLAPTGSFVVMNLCFLDTDPYAM